MSRFDGQIWAPTVFTPPLSDKPVSDGPRLVAVLEKYWRTPNGELLKLDDWQKAGFNHILERYPADWPDPKLAGRLRFRQLVWSMGRQNGKSLIAGGLGLYGLTMHVPGPSVVGVATSVEQANVVYRRVKFAVEHAPALKRILRATGTRGISRRDGTGQYEVKPSLAEGLQSVPVTLGIADELHLAKRAMWDSIVNGQRAQLDAMLAGITTAGDDTSELLNGLYEQGYDAVENQDNPAKQRFGFFLWEAPEGSTVDNPDHIKAANPAIACGRIEVITVQSDVSALPEPDQQRYTLNRFVRAINNWAPIVKWRSLAGTVEIDQSAGPAIAISRTENWEYASIVAAQMTVEGQILVQTVAIINNPTTDKICTLIDQLTAVNVAWVLQGQQCAGVAKHLVQAGAEPWRLTEQETMAAAAGAYAAINTGRIIYADADLLTHQMPIAQRRNIGDGWKLSAADSSDHIDAVQAMIHAVYAAETRPVETNQMFL